MTNMTKPEESRDETHKDDQEDVPLAVDGGIGCWSLIKS